MGSKDRKIVSELVYNYYRLGHSAIQVDIDHKLLAGLYLCNNSSNELLTFFKPDWNKKIQLSLSEKWAFIQQEGLELVPDAIFPWQDALSPAVDKALFNVSHLQQPYLFLRIRPKQENNVIKRLMEAAILYKRIGDNCIQLANSTKIDQVLKIDEEVVIQDYNSQRVGDFFKEMANNGKPTLWDCCAGSGGKSIMAYDTNSAGKLIITDARVSILQNLRSRLSRAGISDYRSSVVDLSVAKVNLPGMFDFVIADVPCSGSGTWSRTPEQLYFFDPQKIKYYSDLQKKIIANVIPAIKSSGYMVYITCSVFKEENEDIVKYIQENFDLRLESAELLQGYELRADSMFAAVFKKII